MWRRQLPAWSPVTLSAIAAGVGASRHDRRNREALTGRLCEGYGSSAVQLANSGTAALALAIIASAPPGQRPRVAMPAWGCYDLMTAADIADADVLLYDLDPTTLGPSVPSFSDVLRLTPTAVVIVHSFGLPVQVSSLLLQVRKAGAVCIEDAAQGAGGSIDGRPLGALGDFGILSFGRGKGRTGGGGGALLANTAQAAAAVDRARHVIQASPGKGGMVGLAAQWALGRPSLYTIPSAIPTLKLGETTYHAPSPIREMAEWSAAVLLGVWARAADASYGRRMAGSMWTRVVSSGGDVSCYAVPAGAVAGWLRFPVLVRDATALRDDVARRLGVMPGYLCTLAELPLAPGRLSNSGPWPGSADLARRLRTFPSHSLVTADDVSAVVRLLGHDPRVP